jgi:hypothetical protein
MRHHRFAATAAVLALAITAACADDPVSPRGASGVGHDVAFLLSDGSDDAVRAVIDLTDGQDLREIIDAELVEPEAARDIGTGSMIVITIPGEGRFGCSANFLWRTPARLYLGSAGHCFLPEDKTATHGENADYDASGVLVDVCVEGCETGFRSGAVDLLGRWVRIGKVAYARQTNPAGTTGVGHDFGVVEIPRKIEEVIRAEMPVWGGPTGTDVLTLGKQACHYGHGIVAGETYPTKARTGIGGGATAIRWSGTFAGTFGDSGSGLLACEPDGTTLRGEGAIGVLTHLGASTADPGVVFGTTLARAVEMAREAKLRLTLVLP